MPNITWSSASAKTRSMTISVDVLIGEEERTSTVDC